MDSMKDRADAGAAIQLAATMSNPRREATLAILWGALKRMTAMREDELSNRDRGELLGELIQAELAALTARFTDLIAKPSGGAEQ